MTAHAVAMSRLTFGDDLSPASDAAWTWVTAQRWPDWRIDILRSIPPSDGPRPSAPARAAAARCAFRSVRTIDSPLAPRAALAAHRGTDLLVVGAQAWTTGPATGLGGTVDALVRRSSSPVVVARAGGPISNVVVCVDESAAASAAASTLLAAAALVERAAVTVLTVVGPDGTPPAQPERVVQTLVGAGVRAHLRVVEPDDVIATSSPAYRIVEVVERVRPDLVVLGAPGRGLASRVRGLRRSVALQVARQVPCSVLLAR